MTVTRVSIVILLLALSMPVAAERYFTWVDEQGRVRHSPIPEDPGKDQKAEKDRQDESEEQADQDEPAGTATGSAYTLENFPDGNEALKESGEKRPYFTWIDAEGRRHNTPYDPSEEPERSSGLPRETKPRPFSSALDVSLSTGGRLSERADPEALELLGLASTPSVLAAFAEKCCMDLSPSSRTIPDTRGIEVRITKDSPTHIFATGESHYQLLRLPQGTAADYLRVRSFVRDGAFVPTLVFLNQALEPQRLVTEISFDFHPETWSRYAYLEALLPLKTDEYADYVLVLTREEDARSQTLIESGERGRSAVQIEHRARGSLEFRMGRD